ncbi:MAG: F0F1 ATP synthase subunit B [Alphaproteobacteria bacterium]|nr:F0F1 ATP synthase subunit B [Alphaproteobacteria bacterium]
MDHFFASPETWVAAAFIIFVALVAKLAWGKIVAGLDQKSAVIKSEIDEARKLRDDAQALLATYQRKQREALQEAEGIIAQARDQAASMRAEAEKALSEALQRRSDLAVEKIARAEAQAVQEVRELAVDVAVAAAEKLISQGLDPARARGLVDQAIGDLGRKLH